MQVQGDRWFMDLKSFSDDLPDLWGPWGCDSEVGTLRAVLMHRPGRELAAIDASNYDRFLFKAPVNVPQLLEQFDALIDIYRDHGVDVQFVQGQREDRPNALYVRDLYVMTPQGAILARPAVATRRGEERAVAATLASLGVPILKTVNGSGTFEGANVMWLNSKVALLGTSVRTNREGAQQVERELYTAGAERVIHVHIAFGRIHFDGYISQVDRCTVAVCPYLIDFDTVEELKECGLTVIEAPNLQEVAQLGLNMVALRPGLVVMPDGFPDTAKALEQAGIETVRVKIDEILKGGGAVHCMTGFLRRDPIGDGGA